VRAGERVKIEGQERLALPPSRAFEALLDPALLRACTPGLVRLDETQPGHFEGTLELKLPAISGRFEGTVDVTERESPSRAKLRLKGKGAPGFVDGTAELVLAEAEGGGSLVGYVADVTVGGNVARLGQRMLSGVAKEMAGQFFDTFGKLTAAQAVSRAAAEAAGEPSRAAPAALPEPPNPILAGLQLVWRLLLRALGLSKRP
jgi:carbon monoxide dehydrogenase subunit G